MRTVWIAAAMVAVCAAGHAAVRTETLEYKDGETPLIGYLAYDGEVEGKRPGVIVVHEWWGLNDHARNSARRLAEHGYVALAVDIYGEGQSTTDPAQAGEWAGQFKQDPALAKRRFEAGLAALKAHAAVDPERTAAIGYCFGGTMVLEMARSGVDLDGVVSFHGGLASAVPEEQRHVKASILVCNGADDPHVSAEEVAGFEAEMRQAGADWQLIQYGGAVHSFTNPAADGSFSAGVKYHPAAARRSWTAMLAFFEELFAK